MTMKVRLEPTVPSTGTESKFTYRRLEIYKIEIRKQEKETEKGINSPDPHENQWDSKHLFCVNIMVRCFLNTTTEKSDQVSISQFKL